MALLLALAPLATGARTGDVASATPVADTPETYAACGRVFTDPLAYWAPGLGEDTPYPGVGSPFAKGNAECRAGYFITYDEAVRGLTFMADELDVTRDFVDIIDLSTTDEYDTLLNRELGDGWSEGQGDTLGERQSEPLWLIRVTAPEAGTQGAQLVDGVEQVAMADRDHFVWSLSAHGIEKAGLEGGLRAIEDLATWASQDPERRLLETIDGETFQTEGGHEAENLRAGEVMMRSVSYFMLTNIDGWRKGDYQEGHASFQRFNGNGMDLNRDWPEIGYVDPEFTPWSESESRSYGNALLDISDEWTGGIDLHGMVEANAFSYTLIGGSQRPYDKNERTMEFVEQAWRDAEQRLSWSPIIKPNDAPEQCVEFSGVAPNGDTHIPLIDEPVDGPLCDQRSYGVQYGTIWDTIDYTATGAIGNWFDSPIGLNADGIDNEMMLSHLGNCGVGTCYIPEAEQLHVDGNKGLIYSMLNFSLQPINERLDGFGFDLEGTNVAYLVNPRRLVDPGVDVPVTPEGALDRADVSGVANTSVGSNVLHTWSVDNDGDGLGAHGEELSDPTAGDYFVQGISGSTRYQNINNESVHLNSVNVEYFNADIGEWEERPTYGSDGAVYRVAGDHSDWNYPADGDYRLVVSTIQPQRLSWELELHTGPVFEDPVQAAYTATNMDFFTELEPWLAEGTTLTAITIDDVLAGNRDLHDFDTVIAVDGALLPGYHEAQTPLQGQLDLPPTDYTAMDAVAVGDALRTYAEQGGNVVLTDDAIEGLVWMDLAAPQDIRRRSVYAGAAMFGDSGYDHHLVQGTNNPGAVEGPGGRRQTVEPLPLGFSINGNNMPQWEVSVALAGEGAAAHDDGWATVAELAVGDGVVRTFGSVLPFPTTAFYHPFGLSSYGLTDHGYTILDNAMTWQNPNQNAGADLSHDFDVIGGWVDSDIPTRIYIDGGDLPFQ